MEFTNEFEVSDIQNIHHTDGVAVQDNNDTYILPNDV
jgi:aspartate-semialdehyde dehydrogenase